MHHIEEEDVQINEQPYEQTILLLKQKSCNIINALFDTYKNEKKVIEKTFHYISNNLPNYVNKIYQNEQLETFLNAKIDDFIEDCFLDDKHNVLI